MNTLPCPQRVFPFRLAAWLPGCYASYLHWLRHLLERLGSECALATWREVPQGYDDTFLQQILGVGWQEAAPAADVEAAVAGRLAEVFSAAVEGVSAEEARGLVEQMPPLRQVRQALPNPNVWRDASAYEVLHLRFDALALLAEALIRRYGKQGELIVYDVLQEERRRAGGGHTGSPAEFFAGFTAEPQEASLFTAGLESELLRASDGEVVLHVRQCEWARYFQERHPSVGYLMACSTDEAAYRTFNAALRMQRTTTLMEGGDICDFRIYALGEAPAPERARQK